MNRIRQVAALLSFDRFCLFHDLFPNDLLLAFNELQYLPADLFPVFVVALQVRPDVGDHLGRFIFFNETNNGENVENFRDEVLEIEIFLLVHEGFHNLLDAALGHHIFLVDETVKDLGQQLTAEDLGSQGSELTAEGCFFVADL